jgi:hypothetical protein
MKTVDEVRDDVLSRIDRAQRNYKLAILSAAVVEGIFLLTFLLTVDFKNRTHLLILIGSVMTYTIVCLGLVALGALINRNALRVMQALESVRRSVAAE